MTTQTIKLNKEKVDFLPRELQKAWEGADVFVTANAQSITISRLQQPRARTLEELKPVLKEIGKEITPQDIEDAIREVRAEQK